MRISESNITMSSKTTSQTHYTREENLKSWVGNEPHSNGRGNISTSLPDSTADTVQISDQAKSMQLQNNDGTNKLEESNYITLELSEKDKQKLKLVEKMIEILTGKKIRFKLPEKIKSDKELSLKDLNIVRTGAQGRSRLGWGVEYDSHESYYESEKMSFNSEGSIKTADGREINFSVSLNMTREFYTEQNIRLRAGDAAKIDPLVINFDGRATGLTNSKFSFDIDSNGQPDQISFVTKGNGFLSLDLNGDGVINNGNELFGPKSGNGFDELAQYDSDGNNWIDENDPIFDKLRIWTKDDDGNDVLFALGQKGIGAIYLGNISTSFDIKNQSNESLGQIQKTGIFVKEDSTVGTIHHIDLSV